MMNEVEGAQTQKRSGLDGRVSDNPKASRPLKLNLTIIKQALCHLSIQRLLQFPRTPNQIRLPKAQARGIFPHSAVSAPTCVLRYVRGVPVCRFIQT